MVFILKPQKNYLNIWKQIPVDERTIIMDTIIIGAGAAGLTAAIFAAENGEHVTVIEHESRPAKKILVTGNGRCNLTNENMDLSCFYGDREFIKDVLTLFNQKSTISFFDGLGLQVIKRNGYVYPAGLQAGAVALALRSRAESLGVKIKTNNIIKSIVKEKDKFVVDVGFEYKGHRLIIATGGKSIPGTGSDGSGYEIAQKMGHNIIEPKPALTALIINDFSLKKASGVRVSGEVTLDDVHKQRGEIQITEYGLSGIPVFNLSRNAEKGSSISIDFFPEYSKKELREMIKRILAIRKKENLISALTGLMNEKLAQAVVFQANIKNENAGSLSIEDIEKIVELVKANRHTVSKRKGFDFAQVTQGGVDCNEINSKTMESKIINGLYFAGEIIDVDGICGGYNLQWAWSSGAIAGGAANGTDKSI